jgi:tetratricopeptide (TPR) repeat protein
MKFRNRILVFLLVGKGVILFGRNTMKASLWVLAIALALQVRPTRTGAQPVGTSPLPTAKEEARADANSSIPAPEERDDAPALSTTDGVTPAPDSIQALYARALALYRSKAYDESAQLADEGSKRYPNTARLQAVLGLSRLATGDHAGAIEALERAASLAPTESCYRLALGRAYYAIGSQREGRAAYGRAVGVSKQDHHSEYIDDATYHLWMADAYAALGLTTRAQREYLQVIAANPHDEYARAAVVRSALQERRETMRAERDVARSRDSPHYALLVNPLMLAAGLLTKVYTAGAELQLGTPDIALDLFPQIAFAGKGNFVGAPTSTFGYGMLVGVRIGFSFSDRYLNGWFFLPRLGPLRMGAKGWSLWELGMELEFGYTFGGHDPPGPVAQIGAGLRVLIPTKDQLRLTTESLPDETLQLRPMLGPMIDVSLGVGWL